MKIPCCRGCGVELAEDEFDFQCVDCELEEDFNEAFPGPIDEVEYF
jgi:hypothetical protein